MSQFLNVTKTCTDQKKICDKIICNKIKVTIFPGTTVHFTRLPKPYIPITLLHAIPKKDHSKQIQSRFPKSETRAFRDPEIQGPSRDQFPPNHPIPDYLLDRQQQISLTIAKEKTQKI